MFVACSTLCFGKYPLERALHIIGELEFSKVDVAMHEQGIHLRPSEVAADVTRAAQRIRIGSSLSPSAFSVEIEAPSADEYQRQLRAVCRLARLATVPVLSVPAASSGSGIDAEAERLTALVRLAEAEGVLLTVDTRTGTLTEAPATAVELCQRVAGLGLTLDPSHYIAGPNQGKSFDAVFPFVRHVRLRDSGAGPTSSRCASGRARSSTAESSPSLALSLRAPADRGNPRHPRRPLRHGARGAQAQVPAGEPGVGRAYAGTISTAPLRLVRRQNGAHASPKCVTRTSALRGDSNTSVQSSPALCHFSWMAATFSRQSFSSLTNLAWSFGDNGWTGSAGLLSRACESSGTQLATSCPPSRHRCAGSVSSRASGDRAPRTSR